MSSETRELTELVFRLCCLGAAGVELVMLTFRNEKVGAISSQGFPRRAHVPQTGFFSSHYWQLARKNREHGRLGADWTLVRRSLQVLQPVRLRTMSVFFFRGGAGLYIMLHDLSVIASSLATFQSYMVLQVAA
jgi:hypothetical protein